MIRAFLPLALLIAPVSASAQGQLPPLNLEQTMLARCSAAFALVAQGQENGNAQAQRYPALADRGSEFFVRAGAQLMDELGLTREQLTQILSREAQSLWDDGTIDEVMPACLALLDS